MGALEGEFRADVAVVGAGIAGCSTVPAALRELRTMLSRYWPDIPTVLVEPGVKTGAGLVADIRRAVERCAQWHGTPEVVVTSAPTELVSGLMAQA